MATIEHLTPRSNGHVPPSLLGGVVAGLGKPRSGSAGDGFVRLCDVVEREVDWYWPGRIARANVVVVAGDGGVGKSTLVQALGAHMTRGRAMPGGHTDVPRSVVIMSAEEDTSAVVRPRMRLMGADLDRVTVLDVDAAPMTLPSGIDVLEARCRAEDAGLLVIDTGPAFLDPGLTSSAEEDVRRFLSPLRTLAERLRMVVIVLVHLNKDTNKSAGHRIMGGAAWRNAPRQVLMVGASPGEDPRETSERLVAVEKNNLGVYPPAVSFRLVGAPDDPSRAIVEWGNEVTGIRASDIVGDPRSGDERSDREAACEFLFAELSEGARPAKDLESAATTAGLSWATVRRAKKDVNARSFKEQFGGGWMWVLDEPSTKVLNPLSTLEGEHLEHLGEITDGKGDLVDPRTEGAQDPVPEHLRSVGVLYEEPGFGVEILRGPFNQGDGGQA